MTNQEITAWVKLQNNINLQKTFDLNLTTWKVGEIIKTIRQKIRKEYMQ